MDIGKSFAGCHAGDFGGRVLTLAERKVIGYIQGRIGPNRVGFRGSVQPIADAVKL